jgi:hypothetical protein
MTQVKKANVINMRRSHAKRTILSRVKGTKYCIMIKQTATNIVNKEA